MIKELCSSSECFIKDTDMKVIIGSLSIFSEKLQWFSSIFS